MAEEGESMPEAIGMKTFALPEKAKLQMQGTTTQLKWQKNGEGFLITIPEKIRKSPPSKYVWVIKATIQG